MKKLPYPGLLLAPFLAPLLASVLSAQTDPAPSGPARWEKDMAAFEAREAKSPSPEGAILFTGSSTVRLWDLAAAWPDAKTVNNGFGGSTLADAIHHFDRLVAPYRPGAVVVYSGDNDLFKGLSPEATAEDFKAFSALVKKTHPGVPVLILSIKPSVKRWALWPQMEKANEIVATLCEGDPDLHFVDVASPMLGPDGGMPGSDWFVADGLHLSESGYDRWTKILGEALENAGVLE